MKKSSTLGIATVLLLATSVVGLAEQAGTATAAAVDCNAVFKAKAAADKNHLVPTAGPRSEHARQAGEQVPPQDAARRTSVDTPGRQLSGA